jgi:hypothetical protein
MSNERELVGHIVRCWTAQKGLPHIGGVGIGRVEHGKCSCSPVEYCIHLHTQVEGVLSSLPGRRQTRMQVVRVRTDKGQKIVGILIPAPYKKAIITKLTEESSHTSVDNYEN